MRARWSIPIVAAALIASAPARASHVALLLTEESNAQQYYERFAERGGLGLLVPGKGPTVSRAEAIEALELETLETAACEQCPVEVYVALPPEGERHNVKRFPIAIVGAGYTGLLVSDRTKIPGLIPISDVAPTIRSLERGERPIIAPTEVPDAVERLKRLDRRLTQAHDSRMPAMLILIGALAGFAALAALLRSRLLARAALLVAPVGLLGSLVLSAVDVRGTLHVSLALAALILGLSLAGARWLDTRERLGGALLIFLVFYAVGLAIDPVANSLAAIGPHPDGGGRYYGITNQVATLLLAPALVAGALLGRRWLVGVALVALVTAASSRIGADGGGALVFAAAFGFLFLRLSGTRITLRRALLGAVAVVLVALLLVGLDGATGGSSHVTRSVEDGPGAVLDDVGRRLEISWDGATSTWYAVAIVLVSVAWLAWLALRRPRFELLDALLLALAVSLVVNDTPTDVVGFGALSAAAVWVWLRLSRTAADAPDLAV